MNTTVSVARGDAADRLLADLLPARHVADDDNPASRPASMARYLVREADSRFRILQRLYDGAVPACIRTQIREQLLADVCIWSDSPVGRGPWPRSSELTRGDLLAFATELQRLAGNGLLQSVLQDVAEIVFSRARAAD